MKLLKAWQKAGRNPSLCAGKLKFTHANFHGFATRFLAAIPDVAIISISFSARHNDIEFALAQGAIAFLTGDPEEFTETISAALSLNLKYGIYWRVVRALKKIAGPEIRTMIEQWQSAQLEKGIEILRSQASPTRVDAIRMLGVHFS